MQMSLSTKMRIQAKYRDPTHEMTDITSNRVRAQAWSARHNPENNKVQTCLKIDEAALFVCDVSSWHKS